MATIKTESQLCFFQYLSFFQNLSCVFFTRFINIDLIKLMTGCIWTLKFNLLVEFSKITNMVLCIYLFPSIVTIITLAWMLAEMDFLEVSNSVV